MNGYRKCKKILYKILLYNKNNRIIKSGSGKVVIPGQLFLL